MGQLQNFFQGAEVVVNLDCGLWNVDCGMMFFTRSMWSSRVLDRV